MKIPEGFENPSDLMLRKNQIVEFLKQYLGNNPLPSKDQKYGVVCHSMTVAAMTADGVDEEDENGLKKGYIFPTNCQLVAYPFPEQIAGKDN